MITGTNLEHVTDLSSLREEYARGGLAEQDLTPSPMPLFQRWYDEAGQLYEPNAMVVATADADGQPSSRFVLLKGFSEEGFVFYTNLASRKGRALADNPKVALLFPWHPLERQVRVEGVASTLSRDTVASYFSQRPRGSQLGAWASHQSAVVDGREELEARYQEAAEQFDGQEVPVPEEWGGYLVRAEVIEFWQGRPGRMHDRLVYRRDGEAWRTARLAP